MGCVQSVKTSGVSSTKIKMKDETLSTNSDVVYPTTSSTSQPYSQSYELAQNPINPSVTSDDEIRLISDYIKAAVNWKNQHGEHKDLDRELERKNEKLICIGSFIVSNNQWKMFEILSTGRKLKNTSIPYKPDLIIKSKETGRIIHTEIDATEDDRRNKIIESYFDGDAYVCIHFSTIRFCNPLRMANVFSHLILGAEGLAYGSSHN